MTSRYCEEQASPGETAARKFLTRPKATARQLNLIPVRLGWLPRGVRDEGEETRERSGPPIWARTFRCEKPASMTLPEKSIDRWSRCNQDACLDDTEIATERLNELSNVFQKYFEIKYYLLVTHVSSFILV